MNSNIPLIKNIARKFLSWKEDGLNDETYKETKIS
jgi:hypothetical protein